MTFSARTLRLAPAALVGLMLVSGCRKAPITSYRIPHETPAAPSPTSASNPSDMASRAVPAANGAPDIHWTLPSEWTNLPDQSGMRKGSFSVKDAEGHEASIAVTVFPGDVGGDLANINRWLGQLQLPPITEAALPATITETVLPIGVFKRVDLVGGDAPADTAHDHRARILGAWLKQDDRTWFFKMNGDSSLVDTQHATFEAFLKSVHFSTSSAMDSAPMAMPAMPVASGTPPAGSGELTWTAPSSWVAKAPGAMRKASYTVAGEADFSVIAFPGQAGGDLANVNRWRGQVQLPPLTDEQLAAETTTLQAGDLTFVVVDFSGQSKTGATRLIGAILPYGGQSYFFKLMGPDTLVAGAKPEFLAFLKSVNAR